MSIPPQARKAGVVIAAIPLVFALGALPVGYQLWQAPPPSILTEGSSMLEYQIALVGAVAVVFFVGLYLARNIYRWSMAGSSEVSS